MTFSLSVQEPSVREVANRILRERHYLGPISRGAPYVDADGVIVVGNPSSRRLPQRSWAELIRWCITGGANAGSRQWARFVSAMRDTRPELTTIVSYSDPSAGHTGALYRASGWIWAPTWHRLRPPPSGNGTWDGVKAQLVKDRWVYPLRPDASRIELLSVRDASIAKLMPWATYAEPTWRRGKADLRGCNGSHARFFAAHSERASEAA